MGVLRVLEGCSRVFEVCLEGVTNDGFPNVYIILQKRPARTGQKCWSATFVVSMLNVATLKV